ncbi:MAG: hypothetical protein OXM54_07465 [Acidimicrobiaceae bacterium]|nr:hypothetical protein [Acidimicrobiaceae bacterium]
MSDPAAPEMRVLDDLDVSAAPAQPRNSLDARRSDGAGLATLKALLDDDGRTAAGDFGGDGGD